LDKTLGHYKLKGAIGHGGMSTVYEGIDERMGRRVAVKVMASSPSSSEEERLAMRSRQLREARVIAALSHPNIVTIHDMGVEGDHPYLVMEYLDGKTLRARMNAGPIPPAEASAILDQAASALDAVHSQGIVHRDLKPSNIMLLSDGRVKLMDFGVARHPDDTMVTMDGMIVGSPTYMAPEQVRSEQSTAASDIWGLGVLLYEMIAGKPPFPGRNIPAILHQVAYEDVPPIEDASAQVQAVVDGALQKDPEKRYKSASEMARAFKAAINAPVAVAPSAPAARSTEVPARTASVPRERSLEAGTAHKSNSGSLPVDTHARQSKLAALAGLAILTVIVSFASFRIFRNESPSSGPVIQQPAARHSSAAKSYTNVINETPISAIHPSATARRRPSKPKPAEPVQVVTAPEPSTLPTPERTQPIHEASQEPPKTLQAEKPKSEPATKPVREASRETPVKPRTETKKPQSDRARIVPPPEQPQQDSEAIPASESPSVHSRVADINRSMQSNAAGEADAGNNDPSSSSDSRSSGAKASSMLGEWQGKIWRNPATLSITRHSGNNFGGTISVDTPEGHVLVGVTGHVSPRTGAVTLQENRIIRSDKPHAWDLGHYSGSAGDNNIGGTGSDTRGRSYPWSFHR